jgi:hypothetical protein
MPSSFPSPEELRALAPKPPAAPLASRPSRRERRAAEREAEQQRSAALEPRRREMRDIARDFVDDHADATRDQVSRLGYAQFRFGDSHELADHVAAELRSRGHNPTVFNNVQNVRVMAEEDTAYSDWTVSL